MTGVWLLLEGEVESHHEGRVRRHVATQDRPVVLVRLDALHRRFDSLLKVTKKAELLHVGFSACAPGGALRSRVLELETLLAS